MKRLLDRTLDLFGVAPLPVPVPVSGPPARVPRVAKPRQTKNKRNQPDVSAGYDLFAPDLGAIQPLRQTRPPVGVAQPEPLGQVLTPANFRHPQANREVALSSGQVAYQLKRGNRRTIGFMVRPEGLTVSIPRWVTQVQVDAALQEKGAWVLRKLGELRQHHDRQVAATVVWADGARLPYLGEPLVVQLAAGELAGGRLQRLDDAQAAADGIRYRLLIGLPPEAGANQLRDAVQAWIMREAQALFVQRLDHYAPQLGVKWSRLALSNAQGRWGSARSDGSIRLNWRLMHFSLPVLDYVVVHELAHLRVMDHSPRFWDTVASVVPDYAARRGVLKQSGVPPW